MQCSQCQTTNPANQRFCGNCGAQLQAPAAPRSIRHDERRWVTILFADIAGFTAIAEQLDPEQVVSYTKACFELLTASVKAFDGTIDKYMGDAMMALFGAPVAHEDDPARALRAALDMIERIIAFNAEHTSLPQPLALHIGVNSGLVVAGQMGAGLVNQDYTVMGDAVNLASRLQDLAGYNQIAVGETTYQMTAPLFDWQPLGPTAIKGKAATVSIYRLMGSKVATNQVRGISSLQAPLIGRDAEFAALQTIVSGLAQAGGVVALLGEPGLGKSRLLAELRQFAAQQPTAPQWAEGRCLSYGQRLDYYPWREIVATLCGFSPPRASGATVQLRAALQKLGVARLDQTQAGLSRLLGISSEAEDASQSKRRIEQSVQSLLRAAAIQQPTIIVLDDLHWADLASLELLDTILAMPPISGLLIIASCRPDGSGGEQLIKRRILGSETGATVSLQPLSADDSNALVAALLHVEGLPESVRQLILSRAEGNPFYVEEVVRSMIDRGLLYRDGEVWRSHPDVTAVEVPPTLVGVISARIDLLPPQERNILQVASVLGRRFRAHALSYTLADIPAAAVDADLQELQRRELLRPLDDDQYSFKHALTQEVAYSTLLLEHRKHYHQRAGDYYAALPRPAHPQAVADVHNLFDAFYHYMQAHSYQAAYELTNLTVDYLDGEPFSFDDALHLWGEIGTIHALYEELATHLEGSARVEVLGRLGVNFMALGELQRGLGYTQQAVALAEQLGDLTAQCVMQGNLGRIHRELGDIPAALQHYARASQLAVELGNRSLEQRWYNNIGNAYRSLGQPEQAISYYHQAIAITRELGDPQGQSYAAANLGWAYIDLDKPDEAIAYLTEALHISRQINDQHNEGGWLGSLGWAYRAAGELEKAIDYSKQALVIARKVGERQREESWLGNLGWIYHELGDYARARVYYTQALDIARQIGNRYDEGVWLERLGLLDHELGQRQEAAQYLTAAHTIAEQIGNLRWQQRVQAAIASLDQAPVLRPPHRLPAQLPATDAAPPPPASLTIYLQPLSAGDSNALIAALLRVEGLPEAVRQSILARAEGNPFYVEEVVRTMIDQGALYHDGEIWRVHDSVAYVAVPPTLVGVISARIDLLPALPRHVLQVAAVLGRRFRAAALRYILDDANVLGGGNALQELQRRELVRLVDEDEYSFKHVLIQEVAYNTLLLEHRRQYHQQAGHYYADLPRPAQPHGLSDLHSLFDAHYHYLQAQNYLAAYALTNLLVYQSGADELTFGGALLHWGEYTAFRRLYEQLPPHLEAGEQMNVLGQLGAVNFNLADLPAALEYTRQALALAEQLGDREAQCGLHIRLGRAHREMGEVPVAFAHYDQALTLARKLGSRQLEEYCLSNIGNAYRLRGEMVQAIDYYRQALTICGELDYLEGQGYNLANIGWGYIGLGEADQAIEHLTQALDIARQLGDVANEGGWLGSLGWAWRIEGELEKALDYSEQALAIARKVGERQRENNWLGNLGWVYHQRSDFALALTYYSQALDIARQIGNRYDEGVWLERLGVLHLDLGVAPEAAAYLDHALDIARSIGNQRWQGQIQASLARVATAPNPAGVV